MSFNAVLNPYSEFGDASNKWFPFFGSFPFVPLAGVRVGCDDNGVPNTPHISTLNFELEGALVENGVKITWVGQMLDALKLVNLQIGLVGVCANPLKVAGRWESVHLVNAICSLEKLLLASATLTIQNY